MFSSRFLVSAFVALAPLAAAHNDVGQIYVKQAVNFDEYPFIAPGPDDVRSPCPGLNILANHGFLNHSGKNITVPALLQAAYDVYNVHPDFNALAAKIGLLTSTDYDTLSLEGIRLHDAIEHDASLSRGDFFVGDGDNFSFNETIYETLASSNPGADHYNATSAAKVLEQRLEIAMAANPKLKNTEKEFNFRLGTAAFYLEVMGDVIAGKAPKKFVDVFFREERLPLEEGWTTPKHETNGSSGIALVQKIAANVAWNATEGQTSSFRMIAGPNNATLDINYPPQQQEA